MPTRMPATNPPGMPSPPCQIFGIVAEVVLESLPVGGDVVEPGADDAGGTAHSEIVPASSRVPTRLASNSRPNTHTAATTPRAIIRP